MPKASIAVSMFFLSSMLPVKSRNLSSNPNLFFTVSKIFFSGSVEKIFDGA